MVEHADLCGKSVVENNIRKRDPVLVGQNDMPGRRKRFGRKDIKQPKNA
jgi:hypothetical protein